MFATIDALHSAVEQAVQMSGFRSTAKRRGSEIAHMTEIAEVAPGLPKPLCSPYAAACLSGYDPATYDGVRQSFVAPRGRNMERIEIQYTEDELGRNLDADTDYGVELSDAELQVVPSTIRSAINRLKDAGFCLRGLGGGAYMATITMTRGRKVGSMGYVAGMNVQLTWLGCN